MAPDHSAGVALGQTRGHLGQDQGLPGLVPLLTEGGPDFVFAVDCSMGTMVRELEEGVGIPRISPLAGPHGPAQLAEECRQCS